MSTMQVRKAKDGETLEMTKKKNKFMNECLSSLGQYLNTFRFLNDNESNMLKRPPECHISASLQVIKINNLILEVCQFLKT